MRGVMLGLLLAASGCDQLFGLTSVEPPGPVDPDAPPVSVLLVQQKPGGATTAATLSVTLDRRPAAGNVLVLAGASDRYDLKLPVGGGVATWARGAASNTNANVEIWYGVTDGSSAAVTIECGNGNPGDMRLVVTEWSGLMSSAILETAGIGSGSSTLPSTGGAQSITTLASPELLFFSMSVFGTLGSQAQGGGTWTPLVSTSAGAAPLSSWYQLVSQPGTFMPTVTVNGDWDAAIVALRAAP